ncbi:hypothetical protein HDU97_004818 [Phlyctochytrium planicorne]|nr:hypothetical protein HDU97_004818 [Phlyctochytrium planicorne]
MIFQTLEHVVADGEKWDKSKEDKKAVGAILRPPLLLTFDTVKHEACIWSVPPTALLDADSQTSLSEIELIAQTDPVSACPYIIAQDEKKITCILRSAFAAEEAEIRTISLADGATLGSAKFPTSSELFNHAIRDGKIVTSKLASIVDSTSAAYFVFDVAANGDVSLTKTVHKDSVGVATHLTSQGHLAAFSESYPVPTAHLRILMNLDVGLAERSVVGDDVSIEIEPHPSPLHQCDHIALSSHLHIPSTNQLILGLSQTIVGNSVTYPSAVWAFNAETFELQWKSSVDILRISQMAYNPDGNVIVVLSNGSEVSLLDPTTGASKIPRTPASAPPLDGGDPWEQSKAQAKSLAAPSFQPFANQQRKSQVLDCTLTTKGVAVAVVVEDSVAIQGEPPFHTTLLAIPPSAILATGGENIRTSPLATAQTIPKELVPAVGAKNTYQKKWVSKLTAEDGVAIISPYRSRQVVVARW